MRIVIPGPPIAKSRPKFSTRGGYPRAYDPQAKQMHALAVILRQEIHKNDLKVPTSLPIEVAFSFYLPLPDSASEPKRNEKLWNLDQCHKPDLDNLIKTWDFANQILWDDDRQIVKLTAKKLYSENPCTIIEIKYINICMDKDVKKVTNLFSPEEMNDFYCELQVMANAIGQMQSYIQEDQYLFLPPAAKEIIEFARKNSKKLAKLAKQD